MNEPLAKYALAQLLTEHIRSFSIMLKHSENLLQQEFRADREDSQRSQAKMLRETCDRSSWVEMSFSGSAFMTRGLRRRLRQFQNVRENFLRQLPVDFKDSRVARKWCENHAKELVAKTIEDLRSLCKNPVKDQN
jgi:hypothetical protein